jgi:cytochrome b pre-mRNA-processing protein 3
MTPNPFAWLRKKRDRKRTARELYGSIVTQARHPGFYAALGLPDSAQGRFEAVLLHLVLVLERLARAGEAGRALAQALSERFIADMDDVMREMTFGDLAVPREVKRAAAALFDRHRVYLAALAGAGDADLPKALAGQLAYLSAGDRLDTLGLAGYMRHARVMLASLPDASLLSGALVWPQLPVFAPRLAAGSIDGARP